MSEISIDGSGKLDNGVTREYSNKHEIKFSSNLVFVGDFCLIKLINKGLLISSFLSSCHMTISSYSKIIGITEIMLLQHSPKGNVSNF